jgi:glutaminase
VGSSQCSRGRLAIAVYSPRLDAQGNSVRGMAVCGDLSDRLGLHLVRPGERVASPIRSSRTLREAASRRARSVEQRRALEEVGQSAVVVELQGELGFAAVELLARRMETSYTAPSVVILDLRRVTAGDPGAVALLEELRDSARAAGTTFAVAGIPSPEVTELLGGFDGFADLDGALEWCEDVLLREAGVGEAPPEVDPAEHELLCGLPGATLALISMMLRPRRHAAGELVVRTGDPSDELFLVVAGELTVVDAAAGERRLATVSAGGTFGELGFVLDVARTADVRADTDVRLLVLDRATVAELRDHHPAVHAALLERLLASLARTTVRLDREARAGAR